MSNPEDVLHFWFQELTERDWFSANPALDDEIRNRFGKVLYAAERGEIFEWRLTTEGRLAEIIILDQFSRNIFRGSPNAFRNDSVALSLSQEMVMLGEDLKLPVRERTFAYMPFMHSESSFIHQKAVNLFKSLRLEEPLKYELLHKDIIDKFGRFPHRNEVLGRFSSSNEKDFLSRHSGF